MTRPTTKPAEVRPEAVHFSTTGVNRRGICTPKHNWFLAASAHVHREAEPDAVWDSVPVQRHGLQLLYGKAYTANGLPPNVCGKS